MSTVRLKRTFGAEILPSMRSTTISGIFSVVDYVGGMADHKTGTLKLIGDPDMRFREDPVRMLRAVRFAVKLGFKN